MIKEFIQKGFILKSKGYYKHAIEAFYKAMELDNTGPELILEIADTYYLMGEEEHTLYYLELILDKNPAHVGALNLLEQIFINKRAYFEAEKTAINIYSITQSASDFARVLELKNKQKKFDEVINSAIDEISSDILYEKSYAMLMTNNVAEAESLINKALESAENNTKYLILKGKILFKQDKKEECLKLSELLSQVDDNADLYNFIGLVKLYKNDFKSALRCFLNAVKSNSENAQYYYNCASTYFKLNDLKLAKKYYNTAISLEPENPAYHFALANLYYSQKQYKRALEELDSDLSEAKLLKAVILCDTGYLALAKKEFESLSAFESENPIIQEYKQKIQSALSIN